MFASNDQSSDDKAFAPAALNAGDAGSHGAENSDVPGAFSACAWATAMPTATNSSKPSANAALFRSMDRVYTRKL